MKNYEGFKMYGYKVGEIVTTKIDVNDENGELIPAGTDIKIVAITPKVYQFPADDPERLDNKAFFYNAIRANQENNYHSRIRQNFVTIAHKKG